MARVNNDVGRLGRRGWGNVGGSLPRRGENLRRTQSAAWQRWRMKPPGVACMLDAFTKNKAIFLHSNCHNLFSLKFCIRHFSSDLARLWQPFVHYLRPKLQLVLVMLRNFILIIPLVLNLMPKIVLRLRIFYNISRDASEKISKTK